MINRIATAGVLCAIGFGVIYWFSLATNDRLNETDLNFLKSAVYDLEHPTPENENIRHIECTDSGARAAAWRGQELSAYLIVAYENGCKALPVRP